MEVVEGVANSDQPDTRNIRLTPGTEQLAVLAVNPSHLSVSFLSQLTPAMH